MVPQTELKGLVTLVLQSSGTKTAIFCLPGGWAPNQFWKLVSSSLLTFQITKMNHIFAALRLQLVLHITWLIAVLWFSNENTFIKVIKVEFWRLYYHFAPKPILQSFQLVKITQPEPTSKSGQLNHQNSENTAHNLESQFYIETILKLLSNF